MPKRDAVNHTRPGNADDADEPYIGPSFKKRSVHGGPSVPTVVSQDKTTEGDTPCAGESNVFLWNTLPFWSEVSKQIKNIERGATQLPPIHVIPLPHVRTPPLELRPIPDPIRLSRPEEQYLDTLEPSRRAMVMTAIRGASTQTVPLRFRVCASSLPPRVKADMMARLMGYDGGSAKYETFVEKALMLPLGKYSPPPQLTSTVEAWVSNARAMMDEAMYGQFMVKDEIVRMLCQFVSSGATRPFALALQGPPGIGKTSFVQRALAPVLNRPFSFFSLGGMSDASTLTGHSYTYEGSQCGSIANALVDHGVMDGVFFFDELDKLSETSRGQEIANALLHMTDRAQNDHFAADKYFQGIDMDFSKAIIIFSFNDERAINPVLLNRMNVVRFDHPTDVDKLEIAKRHLLPRALRAAGMDPDPSKSISISDEVMSKVIARGIKEPGLRGLEKSIGRIVDTCNVLVNGSGRHLRTVGDDIPDVITLPFALTDHIARRCVVESTEHDTPPPLMYC